MALAADLEPQFDGFERFYRCHEVDRNKKDFTPGEPVAAGEFKGLKPGPEFHRKHDGAWLKEGEAAERGKGKGKEKVALRGQDFAIARRWRHAAQTLTGRE